MPNPTISTITLPSGTTYDIADLAAREAAGAGLTFVRSVDAATTPYGIKWMSGATEITGTLVASDDTKSKMYLVPEISATKDIYAEYITVNTSSSGTPTYIWEKIGTTDIDLSDLGDLAYKDSASGSFTPAGSIAVNAASGSGTSYTPEGSIGVNAASGSGTSYTPEGTIGVNAASGSGTSYTPEGSVSAPEISVSSAGSTTSVTPFGSAGSLPSLTMTVSDGNLAISFDQGSLPSGGTAVTVKTGDASYSASTPTFTGTEKKLAFTGTEKKLAFTGTEKKLAFTGTEGTVTVS